MRIAIAGAVIGTAAGITISRTVRWWRTWGVDPIEAAKPLTGDDLVPTPTAIITRGTTIDAPPEAVWPWLVQMGFDRAGWYSYDRMDMRGTSANKIVPAWQKLDVGDVMPVSPDGGFAVKVVEPARALVLFTDTSTVESQAAAASAERPDVPAGLAASGAMLSQIPQDFAASWAFLLEPLDGGRTRLIERFRARFGASGPAFRVAGPFMGFGVFVMMQRQMLGIRRRAQLTAVAPPLAAAMEQPARAKTNGRAAEAGTTEVIASATS
jgi:proline iminopeptidase